MSFPSFECQLQSQSNPLLVQILCVDKQRKIHQILDTTVGS
jgi:hypothetical protein